MSLEASEGSAAVPAWLLNRQHAKAIGEASRKKAAEAAAERESTRRKAPASKLEKEATLSQYPSIPLSEYASDGDHLAINADFPGLRAIHRDPWIFLVSDLLSRAECEELMVKAGPHFQSSGGYSNNFRTSCECRVARHETQRLHARYAKLLNVPVGSLEAAKVSRYRRDEFFRNHVDVLSGTDFLENRIATLFVYLNDCEAGGETRFLSLPSQRSLEYAVGEKVCCLSTGRDVDGEGDYPGVIRAVLEDGSVDVDFDDGDVARVPRSAVRAYETLEVKPAQGMGVLFFPGYLPSSPKAMRFRNQLDRYTVHEGCVAVDEKWVHQSWVWPSHPQAHYDGVETGAVGL